MGMRVGGGGRLGDLRAHRRFLFSSVWGWQGFLSGQYVSLRYRAGGAAGVGLNGRRVCPHAPLPGNGRGCKPLASCFSTMQKPSPARYAARMQLDSTTKPEIRGRVAGQGGAMAAAAAGVVVARVAPAPSLLLPQLG